MCLAVVPVIVPGPGPDYFPPLQGAVLPALGEAFPQAPFQETPLQLLPLEANQYALIHPFLFCGEDEEAHCDDMADHWPPWPLGSTPR